MSFNGHILFEECDSDFEKCHENTITNPKSRQNAVSTAGKHLKKNLLNNMLLKQPSISLTLETHASEWIRSFIYYGKYEEPTSVEKS